MLCSRKTCLLALRSTLLIRLVTMSLVCENKNNGDKLYHRKSMRAADEKLIINELGSYIGRKKIVDVPLNPRKHNVITVTGTDISLTSSVLYSFTSGSALLVRQHLHKNTHRIMRLTSFPDLPHPP